MVNRSLIALFVIVVAGCTAVAVRNMDALYGPQEVRDRVAASGTDLDFQHTAQPIFNREVYGDSTHSNRSSR